MDLKAGDIINHREGKDSSFFTKIGCWGIRLYQKYVFGRKSNYKDIHSMIYFDDNQIFSVEPPKTTYVKLKDLEGYEWSNYRYTKKQIYKKDIRIMREAADKMIDSPYDYGQLLDLGFQEILGYPPYEDKVNIFDFSKKMKVCSVGVGIVYRVFTKANGLPKLFSELNPDYWSKRFIWKFIESGSYWALEQYPPAIFANSYMFNNEFQLIESKKE